MDFKKLTSTLLGLGIIITIGALVWWEHFYSRVVGSNGDLTNYFPCIYSFGGGCGFISGIAKFGGSMSYEPMVFWIGIVSLGLGIILKSSLK
uniref:Uncharacterized protein n=1 Tax=Candidatus Kentrum eta TaxID=2126337 RepID=A0A450VFN5_9GAMM|nr:MAG: hypothetical protein BECKH772B_GA0070898_101855 [Candidatus Kentron sp. H]VFK03594.1 MAG: hypothetical protein BECKH772A_GA0070896_103382 [Candidatus Kentron sp. H]VFK06141.1 MAG: hypothetical protein BECKH772C_GA0070978_103283 [Candidatus Kentron sp. H]